MKQVTLGRTGIVTEKMRLALPIQRVTREYAACCCARLYAGITFFDTARSYSDSEEKNRFCAQRVRES